MQFRLLRLPDAAQAEQWLAECSPERQAQIARLRREESRLQSICASHLAREMLSQALNCPPERLRFAREPGGKPYLVGNEMFFNVSHAGAFVACAVDFQPVGIDVETPREVSETLLQRVCHREELPTDARGFLRIWTAKEAYLKYLGLGLRTELRDINTVRGFPPHKLLQQQTEEYTLSVVYDESYP